MFGKMLLGLLLALSFLPGLGARAQDMFQPLGSEGIKLPGKQLGTVIAPNGTAIKLTENDQGSLDHATPIIERGAGPRKIQSNFSVRHLKTSERLYVVFIRHGIVDGEARPFNRAIPRDKDGGYSHGDQTQLLRLDLYELCESGSPCTYVEELFAILTPEAFALYYAEDGLVLKMVSDDDNFDIVRVPRDHIEAAIAVAAKN
jgi:hypothetical protein